MTKKICFILVLFSICSTTLTYSQNVGVGTNSPEPSAKLDINSTNSGLLPPRMTKAQRDLITTPAAGLIVYCTDCNALQYYDGIRWNTLANIAPTNANRLGADVNGVAANDQSGFSVSLSSDGSRMAIGAPYRSWSGSWSGHCRIYQWNGTAWIQLGSDIDGEASNDRSGWSVSLSADGMRLAVGAPYNDGNGADAGHCRIYQWSGMAWVQMGLDIDGEAVGDQFGYSVSLSSDGSRVAIGAPENDGNGSIAGHCRVFEWSGMAWVQLGMDIDGEVSGDYSGYSVSLSANGMNLAVGAPFNDGNGPNAGQCRIYQWNSTAWVQLGSDIDGETVDDRLGYSISLSANGMRVAVGAPFNDGNGSAAGHCRIYQWSGTAWVQLGADIDGETAGDYSGFSVSLSADGSRVAIGAPLNDGKGANSGHCRLYQWNGITWLQLGTDLIGEAAQDQSGWSVSLSQDGNRVAVGAPLNDGNGTDAGHVRVFFW